MDIHKTTLAIVLSMSICTLSKVTDRRRDSASGNLANDTMAAQFRQCLAEFATERAGRDAAVAYNGMTGQG